MAASSKKHDNKGRSSKPLRPVGKKLKKERKPPNDVPIPAEVSSALLAEAPDFPRGGTKPLSGSETADAKLGKKRSKDRPKNSKGERFGADENDGWASLFGEGIHGKLPRFANRVTLKNVSPNMRLWGVVAEVNTKDLAVSLPGGLRGFVRVEDAIEVRSSQNSKEHDGDLLSSKFHVGQLVPCAVLQVEDEHMEGKASKRIYLSLHLSLLHKGLSLDSVQKGMALYAVVKSVEGHGYILHFGTSFSGFLSKDYEDGVEINLKTSQLVQCVVNHVDRARSLVYASANADLASRSVIKDLKGIAIDSLVPGMMVNARLHAVLENGLMFSFLSYFTGTVDIFNFEKIFPTAAWKDVYSQNQKFNARILFIDPTTRAIGLTLNPHLIHNSVPPCFVKPGDVFDESRIIRIDKGIGLLLEIPSSSGVSPTYISRLDAADEEIQRLEKRFKHGSHVRVRIIGVRHLEGLGIGTLKASAFEGSIFTHEDVKPGMLARAKVIAVENHGAIVQFPSGVKALCPVPHMSEFEISKPSKKFSVGAELLFRILGCKSKRITVTYKKTLLKSKLKVLASFVDAVEGMVTHGWISKIEKHGCFVKFYNGVHGFAHRSELGLEPGMEPTAIYHVGQVIKCRVVSSIPASRRITVSFSLSSKRTMETDSAQIGSHVSGTVTRHTDNAIIVELSTFQKGLIYSEHLADYSGQASILKSLIKPGYKFDKLLVLDTEGNNVVLSGKPSLITSSQLPLDVKQISQHSVVHGYVCNIIGTGCFIRFFGHLTGFCSKSKASDEDIGELSNAFYIGQSVRSYVSNVDIDTGRISLSLKQSCCSSTDASFIENFFLMEGKIAGLQSPCFEDSTINKLEINQVVECVVQEKKEYGAVVNLLGCNDVVGFLTNYHLGGISIKKGSTVKALVLDVSVRDNLVDLSLRPELMSVLGSKKGKKKRHRDAYALLELHEMKNAVVEMVKDNYLVLSIPECNNAIGYASLVDYNTQKFPRKNFTEGQSVLVTIEELPSTSPCGRLLLLLKSLRGVSQTSRVKKAKNKLSYAIGTLVEAEVTDITPTGMFLKFGNDSRGKIHITEVLDVFSLDNPFANFKIGQAITARILAKGGKSYHWEMTVKPPLTSEAENAVNCSKDDFNFVIGQAIGGYVTKVDKDWVSLTVSRSISAQLYLLDSSCVPSELEDFKSRYKIGMPVRGHVIGIDKEKRLLRITSLDLTDDFPEPPSENPMVGRDVEGTDASVVSVPKHMHQGKLVGGRIKKILPGVGGLLVQIGPHLYGKAHYTELVDDWNVDPLSGYQEGQFVRCRVLDVSRSPEGFLHVDLSLRASSVGAQNVNSSEQNNTDASVRHEKMEKLHVGMEVKGYIKNVTSKGCFIMLSRKIDARVLISNLSDSYVEKPEKEFPVGKLVHGRVLSAEALSGRVDVTLKSGKESSISISDFNNLHLGDVISGRIKRIESYGLFISIESTNLVGLCHMSEISEERIENIEGKFKTGDQVKARILKLDPERGRISLGMKTAYLIQHPSNNASSQENDHADYDLFARAPSEPDSSFDLVPHLYGKQVGASLQVPIPPLEVKLDDDVSGSDVDDEAPATKHEIVVEKAKGRAKKREKEMRELEISASEERRLKNEIPRTADDFEKLVRSSPNSSFLWIKYMAFLLSLAEIEKARSVAERALRTINFREENEKLNVWVAYLNLENEYGNPQEEAVRKLFERALQFCDPKRLHISLLGIYERTEKDKLADELLQKMTKKFKQSCKVWLHYVENLLRQHKDDVQSVIKRALLSLPGHKNMKFRSQAAILEFRLGLPDRGRKMFEEILKDHPKRTDIWSIYIDQVIRLGDPDVTRALFERVTCLSLPPKKLKFLYKKYLEYEKSVGDEERVEYVKRKALEYVESSMT